MLAYYTGGEKFLVGAKNEIEKNEKMKLLMDFEVKPKAKNRCNLIKW